MMNKIIILLIVVLFASIVYILLELEGVFDLQ